MATTYELLAKNVLSASAANLTFSSIPGTYTDLLLVHSCRQDNTDGYTSPLFVRYNSSSSSYSNRYIQTNRSTVVESATNAYSVTSALYVGESPGANMTANTMSSGELYIPSYAGSTNKSSSLTAISETNGTGDYTYSLHVGAGLWSNTSAITSITIYAGNLGSRNFVTGSSFYLYGVTHA